MYIKAIRKTWWGESCLQHLHPQDGAAIFAGPDCMFLVYCSRPVHVRCKAGAMLNNQQYTIQTTDLCTTADSDM